MSKIKIFLIILTILIIGIISVVFFTQEGSRRSDISDTISNIIDENINSDLEDAQTFFDIDYSDSLEKEFIANNQNTPLEDLNIFGRSEIDERYVVYSIPSELITSDKLPQIRIQIPELADRFERTYELLIEIVFDTVEGEFIVPPDFSNSFYSARGFSDYDLVFLQEGSVYFSNADFSNQKEMNLGGLAESSIIKDMKVIPNYENRFWFRSQNIFGLGEELWQINFVDSDIYEFEGIITYDIIEDYVQVTNIPDTLVGEIFGGGDERNEDVDPDLKELESGGFYEPLIYDELIGTEVFPISTNKVLLRTDYGASQYWIASSTELNFIPVSVVPPNSSQASCSEDECAIWIFGENTIYTFDAGLDSVGRGDLEKNNLEYQRDDLLSQMFFLNQQTQNFVRYIDDQLEVLVDFEYRSVS
jgi:hypothetical protein